MPEAFVVLKPGATATEKEIIEYCRTNLTAYKVHRSVVFTDMISRTAIDRPDQKDLRAMVAEVRN